MPRMAAMRRVSKLGRDPKIRRLSDVPLFSGLSRRDLARVAELTVEIEVPEGRVLMRKGEPGKEAFVIEEGTAKVTMPGRKSHEMGPGDVFGELALLHNAPRLATVTAETDMHLLALNSREFSTLLDDVPAVGRKVLAAMAERLRSAERGDPRH